jgi:hypothetical protein
MAPALSPQLRHRSVDGISRHDKGSSHCHFSRVTAELLDVFLHPLQGDTFSRQMGDFHTSEKAIDLRSRRPRFPAFAFLTSFPGRNPKAATTKNQDMTAFRGHYLHTRESRVGNRNQRGASTYRDKTSPVIHTNKNNRLFEIDRPRDHGCAVVPEKRNFKRCYKRNRMRTH